jgi:hypothetical protein
MPSPLRRSSGEPESISFREPGGPVADVWTPDGRFDTAKANVIDIETRSWPSEQREAMLVSLRAAEVRARVKKLYKNPAEIAAAVTPPVMIDGQIMPGYVITPALAMIASAIEHVLGSPRKINLMITMPPQEGKSQLTSVWTVIRALQLNANRRIILATYASALAESHSRAIREVITSHGSDVKDSLTRLPVEDRLGLKLARGDNKVSSWSIEGSGGGLVAAGIGAAITGLRADLFVIDDPFKNMMEADSATHRDKVHTWFSTVALTRLSPSASVILIQTRWHPDDLAGRVLAGEKLMPPEQRTWKLINVPAIAEEGITDALRRPPGTAMQSARDLPDSKRDFAATRRQVGERTWYAMYQGSPRNPSGGVFQRKWFEPRLIDAPMWPVAAVVGIDPADSGVGDEAGIIGGMLMQDGRVALTHDRSGQYTADQWSRQGVLLALEMGAREIAVEAYTTAKTYVNNVKRAYQAIHKEAAEKARTGAQLTPVEQRALPDIPPFMVTQWRGANKADAVARSGLLAQALETGRCRTVETSMAVFEDLACDWQVGQHQPDRVAAGIIAHDRLAAMGGGGMTISDPAKSPPTGPPEWMRRTLGG